MSSDSVDKRDDNDSDAYTAAVDRRKDSCKLVDFVSTPNVSVQ